VLGLGNIGAQFARIGLAFGMKVIAWSQNMTTEIAEATGATLVARKELFHEADVVTIHLVLSARTRGLVGGAELALMKPSSWLINTSRGPIVDEGALIRALESRAIAGAAIDVFSVEPCRSMIPFDVSTMCLSRRTSDMSRKTSVAPSTAIRPPLWLRGSTK
jgi:phosphoglycerate dehydrogenase-like enzyme